MNCNNYIIDDKYWNCDELIQNNCFEELSKIDFDCRYKKNSHLIEQCIYHDHDDCLNVLHQKGFTIDESISESAASLGKINCLRYLHENGVVHCKKYICQYASSSGHLDCLIFAHENDYPWNEYCCSSAAAHGNLNCLIYAHENGCPWNFLVCDNASLNGHLECLKYAHENGCDWSIHTLVNAAENGHLECLKYANENGFYSTNHFNTPWSINFVQIAVENGHLDCVKYIFDNICKIDNFMISKYENENDYNYNLFDDDIEIEIEIDVEEEKEKKEKYFRYLLCLVFLYKNQVKLNYDLFFKMNHVKSRIILIRYSLIRISKTFFHKKSYWRSEKTKKELIEYTFHPLRFIDFCLSQEEKNDYLHDGLI